MVAQLSPSTHILRLLDCQGMLRRWFDLITFLLTTKCIVGVNASKKESMLSSKWWMGHRSNLQKFGSSLREKDLIEFVPKSLFKVGVCQTQPIGRLQDKMTTTTQSLSIWFQSPLPSHAKHKAIRAIMYYDFVLSNIIMSDYIWWYMITYD